MNKYLPLKKLQLIRHLIHHQSLKLHHNLLNKYLLKKRIQMVIYKSSIKKSVSHLINDKVHYMNNYLSDIHS